MKKRRLQNRVAESMFSLPVCAVLATLLWFIPWEGFRVSVLTGWLIFGLVTWIITETCNRFALIRVHNRMPSCVWLMLVSVSPFLHSIEAPLLCSLSLAIGFLFLFHCYQQWEPIEALFYSFLSLSLGSLSFPPMLCFVLPWYGYADSLMSAWSWRGFYAGIIGIVLPYWLWGGWCIWQNDFSPLQNHISQVICWHPISWISYTSLSLSWWLIWAGVSLLTLIAILHFLHESYRDKVQVRMYLHLFLIQALLTQLILVTRPDCFPTLMSLLMVCASPFIGHFFTLTHNRFSNLLFLLFLIFLGVVGSFHWGE